LTTDILADEIREFFSFNTENQDNTGEVISLIKNNFPSMNDDEVSKLFQILAFLSRPQNSDTVEIVTTTPVSFQVKARKTRPVIEELLKGAEKTILLTGYSISDHFEETLKLINNKSKQGIVVELFVNKYDSIRSLLNNIEHTNRRFFKVYEYTGKTDDKMAALHAKTIIIDGIKMLISSANLSFHGLEGNIEIGTLVTSWKKAAQVLEIFADLKRSKIFRLIENE
jgi:phosphatidylserine/phosphatidylglycerophosphate/cardiolipin synthase-like enzyme